MVINMYEQMRDLRLDKNLKQREIAEILHCSQRSYSDYERGATNIPIDILIKLADFHNVSIDYLLGRVNEK